MKRFPCVFAALLFFFAQFSVFSQAAPKIQLAVLLDTSNSMDGLINQAKTRLWKIVTELARARRDGAVPVLEASLMEYGNSALPAVGGYMRVVAPLTTDLDKISEELFALDTDGGSEFCGMVIRKAVKELSWSKANDDLKLIFIAGNEAFTQGSIDYKVSCKEAIGNGIIVNTIFCGSLNEGITTGWKDGADRADGSFSNIDQNQEIAEIETPQDTELLNLNNRLNQTYIGFGAEGESGMERQTAQDSMARGASPSMAVQRATAKATEQYRNSSWDLVDAYVVEKLDLESIKKADLPKDMQSMSLAEKKDYLEKKNAERASIKKQIASLSEEREKYIKEKMKDAAQEGTLDEAIVGAVRKAAGKKGFTF